jgi:hypothetical protein
MFYFILISTFTLVITIAVLIKLRLVLTRPRITGKLDEFKTVIALLEFFCERTFKLYSQLQLNPSLLINEHYEEVEYEKHRKDFYKMVAEQMGPEFIRLCLFYFGNEKSFVRFIASYFEDKLINNSSIKSIYNSGLANHVNSTYESKGA